MGVKVIDKGFDNYVRALEALDRARVEVGLFEESGEEVITKGIVNEFGTTRAGPNHNVTIPARSFMRTTFNENIKGVSKEFGLIFMSITDKSKLLNNYFSASNFKIKGKLRRLGMRQERAIKKKITSIKTPPNAASTIAKKASSNPLIDTGEMRASIASRVRNI